MGWGEATTSKGVDPEAGDELAKTVADFLAEPTTGKQDDLQQALAAYRRARAWT